MVVEKSLNLILTNGQEPCTTKRFSVAACTSPCLAASASDSTQMEAERYHHP